MSVVSTIRAYFFPAPTVIVTNVRRSPEPPARIIEQDGSFLIRWDTDLTEILEWVDEHGGRVDH
ncbi:hypothetical protein [Beijerinckia sp. L45]|uniref:hypothetical protein n=1 Tax=Beijerinckia sp. L45 TaxID=1641855 RepID=UPI00131E56C5|nr:hypothetical protein [Beijerinckia sp. L45]